MNENKSVGLAVASMLLGILSLLLGCCFWYISLTTAIIAIVLAAISISKKMGGKGMAIAGLIMGIMSLIPTLIVMITGSSLLARDSLSQSDSKDDTSRNESSIVEEIEDDMSDNESSLVEESKKSDDSSECENISIVSWYLDKDNSNDDVIIVEYSWTNTDDSASSFALSLVDKAYQNGVELDTSIVCDETDLSDSWKDVQPGKTYNFKIGYKLQDMTSVNIIVTPIFGSRELINEKIDLGEGDGKAVAENDLKKTSVKIINHTLSKDYDGNDIVLVDFEFYNGEKKAKSFSTLFSANAFKNGIECESMVFMGLDSDVDLNKGLNDVQSGATYTVTKAFELTDKSDVEIIVTGWLSNKEYLNETISIE